MDSPLSRRTALGGIGAAAVAGLGAAAWSPDPARAAGDPGVTLVDEGTTVTLSNGLISVTVVKATAQIPVLRLAGSRYGNQDVNLVGGSGGQGYSTFDYYVGTTRYSRGVSGGTYRVVTQTDERVEIAISASDPAVLPFTVDIHFTVRRYQPGLYGHLVVGYPPGMPAGLTIQQLRYAFAACDASFSYFVVDDARGVRQRPSIADLAQAVTLQDTTYRLPDGRIYSKYQNISNLEGDNDVFLIANGRLGLALVQAGKEAFAGGPTKQELTCHDYHDGEILLWHPFTSHYGSPDLEPPPGWSKVFGPFYLHVTEAAEAEPVAAVTRMWTDAKRAAARERARWPYRWVSGPEYAADRRGTVSGTLTGADHGPLDRAWVVLAPAGPDREYQGVTLDGDDWQYQNLDYVYQARPDQYGRFTVPAVRPGRYTLAALVPGRFDEYRLPGVVVGPRGRVELGRVRLAAEAPGRTLWQLGTPDRFAGEFQVDGGPDGFRRYLTWLDYPAEFPAEVDLRIGVDDPATAWNYFQPCYRTPGTPLQLQLWGIVADHTLTTWRVRFSGGHHPTRPAVLDVALAGAVFGSLVIGLNDTPLATFDPLPGVPGDNCSYRLAGRGMYRRLPPIVFPASRLDRGENVLTFRPARPPLAPLTRGGTVDDWMEPMAGLMYDAIRLRVTDS